MLHYKNDAAVMDNGCEFQGKIIMEVFKYKMPVILLDKATPKEAVCQVFENVNTGVFH